MEIDTYNTIVQNSSPKDLSPETGSVANQDKVRELKLRQTSKDLEVIFITQMFKAMEKTIPKSSLSGSQNTLSSWLFSSVLGKATANQGGIGLADIIYKSLQEKENLDLPVLEEINTHTFLETLKIQKLLNNEIE